MTGSYILHWEFDPIALQLGPLTLHWYGVCWMFAFLQAYYFSRKILICLGREDVDVGELIMAALIGTVAGARLAHCLFYDTAFYLSYPLKILAIWEGGLASHGGAVGFVIAIAWAANKHAKDMPLLMLLDIASISACLGGAIVRVANFLNSEILGVPTLGSWGIIFDSVDQIPRIPVQLFEAFTYILIWVFLFWQYRYRDALARSGKLTAWFLILIFGARSVLEFWKMPQAANELDNFVSVGQWLSAPFVLAGLFILLRSTRISR